ncbi:MAG: VanZ family protein [Muribaculaceae bacterium]|nr:VanZ family protein [Muribaculaceae bacterium]
MKNRYKEILISFPAWTFSAVTIGIILWLTLSSSPLGEYQPKLFPGADKLAHALMFGFLVVMLWLDKWRFSGFRSVGYPFLICASIATSIFGIAIEFLQDQMHSGRTLEVADMVADSVGALTAGLVCCFFQPKSSDK